MSNKKRNLAERKIAKHKKHGWSHKKQLKELKEIESSYAEKGMELSPIQKTRKQILTEKTRGE